MCCARACACRTSLTRARRLDKEKQLEFRASREVRHAIIRVITTHLDDDAMVSRQGLNLDFTGVFFDGDNFYGANFSGGEVNFMRAEFSGGAVYFNNAEFIGGQVYYEVGSSRTNADNAARSAQSGRGRAA